MRHDRGARGLLDELRGDLTEGDPRGRLAGAGPLEDRTGLVEVVLLHAGEIGVTRARAGQGRVALEPLEHLGIDRIGCHDLVPLGPLRVADAQGDRAAQGQAVTHPADDLEDVGLERHACASAVAETAAREGRVDVLGRDGHPGRDALDQGGERRAV